jgi:tryptophan synthase alpha chain
MNRYDVTFKRLRERDEIAFIPFAVAGDPDLAQSEKIFQAYLGSGADILEIGYPFSDPIADGPVNQRAGQRAIESGLTHATFFRLMGSLRARTDVPFGLLCYANTVHHLGCDAFCRQAARAGIDSILVADMPPEESGEMYRAMKKHGLATVHIVSELTPESRIREICRHIDGFVYIVSRLGPTGAQKDLSASVKGTLSRVRRYTDRPLCVGFGLSKPEHIVEVRKAGADGAIVGSALVKTIENDLEDRKMMLTHLSKMVKSYKRATIFK